MTKINHRYFLIVACLFCFGTGFVYMMANPSPIVVREDAVEYDKIGWNIAQGRGFSLDGKSPTAIRGPIYPYFLAAIYFIFGHNYSAIFVIQILMHVVNCFLIFLIAREAYNETSGIIAAFLYAFYPGFIFYTGLILSETLTILLLQCSILVLVKGLNDHAIKLVGISGMVLGLSTLCRPTTILYPVFLSVILMIFKNTRHLVRYGLSFMIAMILTLTPWIIRNYVEFGKFIPVSVFSGYNLLLGSISQDNQTFDINAFKNNYWTDPIEMDREAFHQGWENIISNPVDYILMMPQKLIHFLLPEGMAIIGSSHTLQGVTLIAFQLIILAFALIGSFREKVSEKTLIFISLSIYFGLVHIIFISTPRFNLPIMPYVLILASIGMRWFKNLGVTRSTFHL